MQTSIIGQKEIDLRRCGDGQMEGIERFHALVCSQLCEDTNRFGSEGEKGDRFGIEVSLNQASSAIVMRS